MPTEYNLGKSGYGRDKTIEIASDEMCEKCEFKSEIDLTASFDTSNGEYGPITLCEKCLVKMFNVERKKAKLDLKPIVVPPTYILEIFPTEEGSQYYKNENRNNDNAGYDVFTSTNTTLTPEQDFTLIDLGFRARMIRIQDNEEVHYILAPRSSITKSGIFMGNSNGIIDRSYRGVVKGNICKINPTKTITIEAGTRLFQVLAPDMGHIQEIKIVTSLPETSRGEGGFGSSGLK